MRFSYVTTGLIFLIKDNPIQVFLIYLKVKISALVRPSPLLRMGRTFATLQHSGNIADCEEQLNPASRFLVGA